MIIAFQNTFKNIEEFDAWLQKAQAEDIVYPWEKEGAKKPSEYTWDEFMTLELGEQIAFQFAFGQTQTFDQWLAANEPK